MKKKNMWICQKHIYGLCKLKIQLTSAHTSVEVGTTFKITKTRHNGNSKILKFIDSGR